MEKRLLSNKLTALFNENKDRNGYLKGYCRYLSDLLEKIDYASIEAVMDCLEDARTRSSIIFFAGNGGSAATASHFAQDLAEVGRKTGKACFKTMSLADGVPAMTAIANDYGYDAVFTGQMSGLFKERDVLVAISASGNSPNVVKAVEYAKTLGGITIGMVGFDGGKLARMCDHVIHVKTQWGEYGPVEDIHLVLDHMITSYFVLQGSRRGKEKKPAGTTGVR